MFASVDLARRIEGAEARMSAEIARAVMSRRPEARAFAREIGGGVGVFSGPMSPMNKLIGAGFGVGPNADTLDAIEADFDERHAPLQAEIASLAEPQWHATLSRRGYRLQGFENVLGRRLEDAGHRVDGVENVADADVATWATMLMDGFEKPDIEGVTPEQLPPREVVEQIVGDMVGIPGLRRYVIRDGRRMMSGASMRVDDRVAQLTGSATVFDGRRRGYQSRLIVARLIDAAALGCDVAVVTTSPGSKSQENLQKQGFHLLYSRALLVREPR